MLYNRIIQTLTEQNTSYTEHRHEPVRTSEEAAKIRGSDLNVGAKALIFWGFKADNSKEPIQLVLQGSKKVDKEKFIQEHKEYTKIKMVSTEEVMQIAKVAPGGVPPFGNLFDPSIKIYVDENLLKLNYIEFNAGDRSISVKLLCSNWQKLTNPIVSSFCIQEKANE